MTCFDRGQTQGVLLRFCKDRIAVSVDVKKMFIQATAPRIDRVAARFLWWPRGDLTLEHLEYPLDQTTGRYLAIYHTITVEICIVRRQHRRHSIQRASNESQLPVCLASPTILRDCMPLSHMSSSVAPLDGVEFTKVHVRN